MIDYQQIFPFYALPYWKLQLENPAWNPTQNPNSKEFCSEVKFRLRTTTFSRQQSVFKRCSIDRSITEKLQILAR